MVLTQRRRTDSGILPSATDADYDPKAKPKAPAPVTEHPLVRILLGVAALLTLMIGGYIYGQTHAPPDHHHHHHHGAAAKAKSGPHHHHHHKAGAGGEAAHAHHHAHAGGGGGAGAGSTTPPLPSSRSIVEEEERLLGAVPRIFSAVDLDKAKAAYLANPDSGAAPILLSIVGHVFDVSSGKEFYAPGEGYDFFSFRDGSRAFVTGTFTEEGLTDDLEGLEPGECQGVLRWLRFFQDKDEYPFVGRLAGRFFDADGKPTPAYLAFRECAYRTVAESAAASAEPEACATRWAKDEGHKVWCEDESKVPRRLVGAEGGRGRCVCVDPTEAAARASESLQAYPGCDPHSHVCTF